MNPGKSFSLVSHRLTGRKNFIGQELTICSWSPFEGSVNVKLSLLPECWEKVEASGNMGKETSINNKDIIFEHNILYIQFRLEG